MKTIKHNITRIIVALVISYSKLNAQLPYTETFDSGTCNTSFPANWNTVSTTPDWLIDDNSTTCFGGVPQCSLGSGGSVLAGADGASGLESAVSGSFSTLGYNNITVNWNGYRSTGAPSLTFEYSFDNVTYAPVAFTDVNTDDAWHAINTITLPNACSNKSCVYLRWSYTSTSMGAFIAFDDLSVNGTPYNIFYWNGNSPHLLSSWGSNPNGTGANPSSFSANGQTYNFYNNTSSNFTPILYGNWSVSGSSVNINLGNGNTIKTKLTIPSSYSLSINNANLNVFNNSTLTIANVSIPTASCIVLNNGSTLEYAQTTNVPVSNKTYYNLIISGADKTLTGNTVINGELKLSGANLKMANSGILSLTLNGTISGNGSLLTGNSHLNIGGSGNLGTIKFAPGASSLTINKLTINRTGGSVILGNNLTVSGITNITNGIVDVNGTTLTLNGQITFPTSTSNGSFFGSTTSCINIGGSGSITNAILFNQTSSTSNSLKDLTLNRTGATLNLGNALSIWGSITPTVGTIAAGSGNLTIKSDNTLKGRIGEMGANGALTGASIKVETMAKGGHTGYANLGAAGVKGQTFADWNDNFIITCLTCPNGSVTSTIPFTSISAYDETAFVGDATNAAHYVNISNITDSMNVGKGWWVYLGNSPATVSDILIDVAGSVVQGNLNPMPLTVTGGASINNGWNLLANPYASPISFSKVIASNTNNVENTLYVWNADLNGGNGDYAIYTPSVGSVPPVNAGGIDDNIPTGQGFSIRALSNCSLMPVENWKTNTASTNALLKMNTSASTTSNMFILNLTGGNSVKSFNTMTGISTNPNATMGYDVQFDAHHISNAFGNAEIFTTAGTDKLKINSIPPVNGTISIPVTVKSAYSGSYQIAPVNITNFPMGACIKLYDRFTNVTHDLRTGAYNFNFIDTTTVNRFVLTITLNQLNSTATSTNPQCKKLNNGSVIASGISNGPWNYYWKDSTGNVVRTTYNTNKADTLRNLSAGNYHVDIASVGSCNNASKDFTLTLGNPLPVASFIVSADSINVNGSAPLLLTNTSANATNFTWNFGDGNTTNTFNAVHSYTVAGEYDIYLYAINPVCGDSSYTTYHVKAFSGSFPTSINENNIATSENVLVNKTENGVYVEINSELNTSNNYIDIYNVIGQKLINTIIINENNKKLHIPVQSNEEILLINLQFNNKNITKKILNH